MIAQPHATAFFTFATMRAVWIIVSAALVAAGCGCGRPVLRPLGTEARVLAFGDSLTAGTGAEADEDYPAVLASLLGCDVVNAGVPGERSGEGAERLPGVLRQHRPDLVILCHGGNDFLNREGDAAVAENLQRMVDAVRESGADVVLVGVPKPGLFLKSAPFYREVAQRNRVPCEEKALPSILGSAALKSDPIHPNAGGYRLLAERVAALIRKSGG